LYKKFEILNGTNSNINIDNINIDNNNETNEKEMKVFLSFPQYREILKTSLETIL